MKLHYLLGAKCLLSRCSLHFSHDILHTQQKFTAQGRVFQIWGMCKQHTAAGCSKRGYYLQELTAFDQKTHQQIKPI